MEELLHVWIEDRRSNGFPLSGNLIRTQAKSLYADVQNTSGESSTGRTFSASCGWFARFKSRYNLRNVSLLGERASADAEAANSFVDDFETVISDLGLSPKQVYNVDETGLYWKKMPKSTYITKNETTAPGIKPYKNRLTLLLGGNAKGDCKLKPALIYQSQNPKAMKNTNKNDLPVIWFSNKKAWMTQSIFKEWFSDHFVPFVTRYNEQENLANKALLLLDNASGHPKDLAAEHPNITVLFLPPNTTSLLQPMDQGVVAIFKAYYLREIMSAMLTHTNGEKPSVMSFWKEYDIKDAVCKIADSWDKVTRSAMNGVWRKLWESCVGSDAMNAGSLSGEL